MSSRNHEEMADVRAAFRAGRIDKLTYASTMQEHHQSLFEHSRYLADSDVAEIRIRENEVIVVSAATGIQLVADPDDAHLMANTLLHFSGHEVELQKLVLRLAQNEHTVFDVGANVGWYSIRFAASPATRAVYAFEPIAKSCAMLRRNLELNGVDKVEVFNQGVADVEEQRTFYYTDRCSGATSMEVIPHLPDLERLTLPVTTIDRFAEERGLKPGLIKCDVEGAELLVMRGALNTLERHRPALLLEMLRKWAKKFDYHPNEIIDLLAGLGYGCYTPERQKLRRFARMTDDTVETNFIFLHEEAHRDAVAELT